ncbi:conserved membrane hypothetical protein [Vibrio chagasii]|nr:conserved membrane hypothetical protein [Vibrio chagasii]CAH7155777.1 conserved membrane hypothetical protein [Vibrio chagasii]CAH7210362.1 conserved membrane hypothetical protein [Vibrio chagasii]
MLINSRRLDYRGYLFLLALGGLLPFSAFNMVVLLILLIRVSMSLSSKHAVKFDNKFFILFFSFSIIVLVFTYHIIVGEFRYVWIFRYSFLLLSIYIIITQRVVFYVNNLSLVAVVTSLYLFSDIYQLGTGSALFLNGQNRTYGLSLERIVFSNFVIVFCFLLILLYESENKINSIRKYFFTNGLKLLCFVHVFLSGSRSFILVLLLLSFFKRWRTSSIVVRAFIIVSMILTFIILQNVNQRFATIFDTSFGSNYSRLMFINHGVDLWKDNFYFGAGPGRSIDYLNSIVSENMPAMHFDTLLVLSELGMLGGIVFLSQFYLLRNGKNLVMMAVLFFLTLQNSLYYTAYILVIIIAIESLRYEKNG